MSAASFEWLPFDRLSGRQVHDLLQLRQRVFVVEQQCAYLDADGLDAKCWHGLGTLSNVLVSTARIVPPGLVAAEPAIGRVVSSPDHRKQGLGKQLMLEAIAQTRRLYPGQAIVIGAQRYLERFYGGLGFVISGSPYDEDGIPHVPMRREA